MVNPGVPEVQRYGEAGDPEAELACPSHGTGTLSVVLGGVGGLSRHGGAPASKPGRNWPLGSGLVLRGLALVPAVPAECNEMPALMSKISEFCQDVVKQRLFFFPKIPLRGGGECLGGGLQGAHNTRTWVRKVHITGADSYGFPKHPHTLHSKTHLNPPERRPPSPGRPRRAPVPPSPPSASAGTPCPAAFAA